jgi:nucleotide-binding universal stress UspA family protein
MYRCILAPVDGTAFGERALPLASSIARRSGATLHLVHVKVPLIAPAGMDAVAVGGVWALDGTGPERSYLEELAERLREVHSIEVRVAFLHGPVAPMLEQYGRDCDVNAVIMSTHAHSRFSRLWHHGIAEHVSRALPIPVLLARFDAGDEIAPDLTERVELRHILVPLDGTPHAEAILEHALAVGGLFRSRYTLLRVLEPITRSGSRATIGRAAALQYLNAIAERLRSMRLDVRTRVVFSERAADAIVAFASARNTPGGRIDCIAMESHPHRPLSLLLGGHTVDAVLRDSPVPVLLFEPPPDAPVPRVHLPGLSVEG